jgi:glutamate transport system substrate-binding protein
MTAVRLIPAVRPVLAALICLIIASCGLAEPVGGAFPTDSTMARIERRGVLTVSIAFDLPMFGYKDPATGRITGFDAEVARMVAKAVTGSEQNIRFIETVPSNREDFLQRGVVDIVVDTYSITEERRRLVGFTVPYYYAGQDALVRADDKDTLGVADLAGKKVCMASGTTSVGQLRSRSPRSQLVIVDAYSECLPPLLDGRIDAMSTDNTILLGLLSRYPDQLRLVGKPFSKEPYGIGVRKDDTVFRDYLDGLIVRYLRDGGWDRAFRDTIGTSGVSVASAKPAVSPS